jgi:uncharacterized protein (DUF1800 family)
MVTMRKNLSWGVKGIVLAWILLVGSLAPVLAQSGTLSSLSVASLSPEFSPAIKTYSIPRTSACAVPVTATLATATQRLYVSNMETASGTTRSAWVCDGRTKIDIVIYAGWTEVGRYTINVVAAPPAPPPPPPAPATLSSLVVADLSPAFNPMTREYTIPRTASCAVPVTATLSTPTHKLQIQNTDTASGAMRQAYVCDGRTKIDIVLYQVWTEVGRYTITPVGQAPPPGPPPPPPPPPVPPSEPLLQPSPAPVFTDLLPAPSPATVDVARRFLRQATFGPTSADMAFVQAHGIDYWLTQQFKMPASPIPDGLDINALRAHMFTLMATGPDQLRQRVAFALSQLLVVSANKNTNGDEIIPWLRLLSTHAFGNYRALLREATVSPSMGKFLDLANSVGGAANIAPNENYPRELLQLFSLGIWKLKHNGTLELDAQGQPIPTYNQATLQAVARALSGWTYPTAPGAPYRSMNNVYMVGLMEARPANHDRGAKTIFNTTIPANQTVTDDMEDVIDIIFAHANLPPFIATRLIRALVTSNPTPEYIARVADVFADNGQGVRGDLRAVITAVLTDDDAALPALTDGRLTDPVLNVIGFGRAMDAQFGDANQFQYILGNLGQHLLTPASVFNFYSPLAPLPGGQGYFGPEFMIYPPALAIHRANFIYSILTGQMTSAIKVNLAPYVALANNPQALVSLVDEKLLQGRMSSDLRAILVSSADLVSDPTQRAIGAIYLAAISSEFLVHAGY